jgi:G3E family GTPase
MERFPVLLLTGALGSGKTTLLRALLRDPRAGNVAVIVNEIGDVLVDHDLVRRVDEKTVVMGSGCVCCSMRSDLADELHDLLYRRAQGVIPPFDRIVVETTGIAEPAPIVRTILADAALANQVRLEHVVTVVDAVNGAAQEAESGSWAQQVAAADRLVVSKSDLVDARPVEAALRRINPTAELSRASFGEADLGPLLEPAGTSWEVPEIEPPTGGEEHSVSAGTVDLPRGVDWTVLGIWLSMLLQAHGDDILRVKGLVDVGEGGPVVINGVRHVVDPPLHLDEPPEGEVASRLVFITRSIPVADLQRSVSAFLAEFQRDRSAVPYDHHVGIRNS